MTTRVQVTPLQPRLFDNAIGRSENKTMKKFSSFANEVRPGAVVISIIFVYLQEVNPLIRDMSNLTTMFDQDKDYDLVK